MSRCHSTPSTTVCVVPSGPRDPHQHAQLIAERARTAWLGKHGSDHPEVPLSVVAALSLLSDQTRLPDAMTADILALDITGFAEVVGELWTTFAQARPDLTATAWPLMSIWHDRDHPPSRERLLGAHAVGVAALRADLLGLTASGRRYEIDLLGALLTSLRPNPVLQDRGQFFTAPALCELIARMLGITEHEVVLDPAAGTGGMLRAAAQRMRAAGRDPSQSTWIAADSDPVAIACAAVNTVSWGLGPRVLLSLGDTLAEDPRRIPAPSCRAIHDGGAVA